MIISRYTKIELTEDDITTLVNAAEICSMLGEEALGEYEMEFAELAYQLRAIAREGSFEVSE